MPDQLQVDPVGNYFPPGPYNLDVPPPGQEIGPIRAAVNAANEAVAAFISAEIILLAQITVQTAFGLHLDYHGQLYGVGRLAGELDDPYRARILGAIKRGKLTIPALTSLLTLYYESTRPANEVPAVYIYDMQSNSVQAAIDVVPDIVTGAPRTGLIPGEFMIQVSTPVPVSLGFFAGRSYVGRAYLVNPTPEIVESSGYSDLGAVNVIETNKASGTRPLWKLIETFVAG